MDSKFVPSLIELTEKYAAASRLSARLEDGAVIVECDKGKFRFFYDFNIQLPQDDYKNVPLFHWRQKRRYTELLGLVRRDMVGKALAMRIHHIVAPDAYTKSLRDVLLYESDLFQYISGGRIDRVFADFSADRYTNCIMSAGAMKASKELGLSAPGSESVLLHEVVGRKGIASDLPVDIQMQQYPIYLIKGDGIQTFNEIDFELYGMDNTQADMIRFILHSLSVSEETDRLCLEYAHLDKIWQAAVKSSENLTYTFVEE